MKLSADVIYRGRERRLGETNLMFKIRYKTMKILITTLTGLTIGMLMTLAAMQLAAMVVQELRQRIASPVRA